MLKATLAVNSAKIITALIQYFKMGSGTSLPGKIAQKIDAGILSYLGKQVKKSTIVVTGTNGKTTTCGLLAQFLKENNQQVIHNHLGANMVPGITAAIVDEAGPLATLNADYAVLEVDEASMSGLTSQIPVKVVVVNNLFRDQLDRYGELDTTKKLIQKGIDNTGVSQGNCMLILNGDDPLVSNIGDPYPDSQTLYYGIEQISYLNFQHSEHAIPYNREVTQCPQCNHSLAYKTQTFAHLGNYFCSSCSYLRPPLTIAAEQVDIHADYTDVLLRYGTQSTSSIRLPLPGLFNVYNLLAAAAAAYQMDLPLSSVCSGVQHYQSVFGRAEKRVLSGKSVMVMLIKNPTGATEVLKLVANDPSARLLFVLNDDYADGRDVSWIWDTQFDVLPVSKPITVSGSRAFDMALCLKYAGISEKNIMLEPTLSQALDTAVEHCDKQETLYILPTYTALLDLKKRWA